MSSKLNEDSGSVENGSTSFQKLLECIQAWEPKLTFIGGGRIATALICGFESVAVGICKCVRVERIPNSSSWPRNRFLSVKPQMRTAMLEELSKKAFTDTPLIVSVMGGVDVKTLEKEVATKGYISRGVVHLMPNLPVSVFSAASIMCCSSCLVEEKCIMQHVGICLVVNEKSFDAAGAVAGCGPAFVFMAIEALSDGGVLGGIDRTAAMKLAAQTVMGAARIVLEASEHPAALKDDVCSAGGSTIYGVKELEKNGFRSALIEAVHASTKRSSEQV